MTDPKQQNRNIDDKVQREIERNPFETVQKTEIESGFDNLDSASHLDKNTRLERFEIDNIITIQELISQGILPGIDITENFKKLKISEKGRGREEKVRMFIGNREQQTNGGFMDRMKNLFSRQV